MTLYEALVQPFADFAFMRRALVGSVVLSVGTAPVGVFLMLRRMSLTGDAMAHAILPGAAVGFLLAGLDLVAMTAGGIVAGLVVALLTSAVSRSTVLREDASMASFYLISLALGVLIVSLRGSPVDLMHVLFGTVLALNDQSLWFIAGVASVTVLTFAVIWRPLVMECVDPAWLRVVSGSGAAVHAVFMVLMVLNLVAGYQALGTLLSVGIMMLPAAASRFWSHEIGAMTTIAALIAAVSAVTGLLASYHFDLPSGPAIILVAGAVYVVSLLAGPTGGLIPRLLPAPHRSN
ncbi:zinc ABC transporter permease AztB [Oharaeibacter diazotrophicus]|uniref:Zinc/manganese transport system permease protein n=1 Tax=Oharaeibacter diazotrophicus TaxID=1920512 RepID=A0A4R6RAC1_9HYPH|nr:zinc ABC transporter permease AztB [Oharaeibacter diazotrophicus]TDP82587.1 zinc/manganese transport system permease protein [Oharaeibacter diazotrophicus]BBE72649.1 manganese transport system membrane protein MntB [Pleomorphomonas sp. SM30]GLS76683.1 zinc ABC transporter permease [Oharaeibacter diazotrophicus]